jgi:hypothetical protein
MKDLHGKVKMEGGGFDWKILGPDVPSELNLIDYIAYQCDQDAYACSGQKCSAQSILMVHENWTQKTDILERLASLANRRSLEDLTVGPTLSVTSTQIREHIERLLQIPGAKVLWGGSEINNGAHSIPACYGAMRPTAVYVPIDGILAGEDNFRAVTREIFAPFQVVTEFKDRDVPKVGYMRVCMCAFRVWGQVLMRAFLAMTMHTRWETWKAVMDPPCTQDVPVYIHVCVYICMYACIYVCMCVYTYIHTYIYMYIYIYIYICIYIYTYVYTYIYIYVCVCVAFYAFSAWWT